MRVIGFIFDEVAQYSGSIVIHGCCVYFQKMRHSLACPHFAGHKAAQPVRWHCITSMFCFVYKYLDSIFRSDFFLWLRECSQSPVFGSVHCSPAAMASYTAYSGYTRPPQTYLGSYYDKTQAQAYSDYQDSVNEEKKRIEKKDRREAICCEVVALVIGFIGLIGVAATTGLPMWKVTAFIEENIIVMETRWEGLWMNCYRQANIRMQCKVYDSLLFLPPELQASRGLMCSSVALSCFALIVSAVGMKCTKVVDHRARTKHIVLVTGGCLFLMGCVTTLIPVSWTGHVIIRDFYNPLLIDAQRRELGEALYIGWVTSALLFTAGVILLCRHAPRTQEPDERIVYNPGGNIYQPAYTNQPYTYQPAYSYQPTYSAPPPGSVAYTPSQY